MGWLEEQTKAKPRTPEDLELMLEDAFIVGDVAAMTGLFEDQALLVSGRERFEARGRHAIERAITSVWDEQRYVAETSSCFQVGDVALSGDRLGKVLRRGPSGVWKVVIAVLGDGSDEESNDD